MPNTGTPVPGGLQFTEANYLIHQVVESEDHIGFDLCETAGIGNDWDGNVEEGPLRNLANAMGRSHGKI